MSMIFRRPMFRRGGKVDGRGTGITSGLDKPRQNYAEGDIVDIYEKMQKRIPEPPKPSLSLGDYLRIASAGAEILGAPGEGGGISGALRSAARPLATLGTDLGTSLDKRAASSEQSRDELVRALTAGQADITIEQMKQSVDEKAIARLEATYKPIIKEIDNKIAILEKAPQQTEDTKKAIDELNKQKAAQESELNVKIDRILVPGKSRSEQIIDVYTALVKAEAEANVGGQIDKDKIYREAEAIVDQARSSRAEGGIAQDGAIEEMSIEPQQTSLQPPQPSVDISYDEFRTKMPANVSDEIVQLIYYNPTAFSDFANIETQDDVYEFNAKYDVNLVLPFKTETT